MPNGFGKKDSAVNMWMVVRWC